MTHSPEEKITLLEQFDSALERWFNGKVDQGDRKALRKSLNPNNDQQGRVPEQIFFE